MCVCVRARARACVCVCVFERERERRDRDRERESMCLLSEAIAHMQCDSLIYGWFILSRIETLLQPNLPFLPPLSLSLLVPAVSVSLATQLWENSDCKVKAYRCL